jgi:hypothetical protein
MAAIAQRTGQTPAILGPREILDRQRTHGNRHVQRLVQLVRAGHAPAVAASRSNIIMRQVNYEETAKYITKNVYREGQLVQLALNNAPAHVKDTLDETVANANLQATTTFFHGAEHGLLPDVPAWADRKISPFIEFNVVKKSGLDRIVYDVRDGKVFLNAHYDGFIQVTGLLAAAVGHLETVAATNIGYLFPPYDAGQRTANTLINQLRVWRAQNPDE